MRVARRIRAALACAAVAATITPAGADAVACSVLQRSGDDGWVHVPAPTFRSGEQAIRGLGVDRLSPNQPIYVTNGIVVLRSIDHGCTWLDVSPPASGDLDGLLESRIDLLRVSDSGVSFPRTGRAGSLVVVAGTRRLAGTVSQPFLEVSRDGGLTWHDAGAGLDQAGPPVDVQLAQYRGSCGWLLTRPTVVGGTEIGYRLWYSPDIGAVPWAERTPTGGLFAADQIATDAMDCETLWVARDGTLSVTDDAGESYETEAALGFRVGVLHSSRSLRSPRRAFATEVSAFAVGAPDWAVVHERGEGARRIPVPDVVDAVADGGRDLFVAVSTPSGIYGYNPATGDWADMTPDGPPPSGITSLLAGARAAADRDGFTVWVAHTEEELLLRGTRGFVNVPSGVRRGPPRVVPGRPSTQVLSLTPDSVELALRPGERARVPFRFTVPARVRPLDVDLLVDTTNSMQQAIDGVRHGMAGIVNALSAERFDLRVGLADFKDVAATDLRIDERQTYVYRRHLRMAKPGPGLETALRALRQHGAGDDAEAATVALVESATGRGIPGIVPAGGEAAFRPAATRVVVLVTDNPFKQGPPYPSIADTVATLRAEGVRVVGVSVLNGGADADGSLRDLGAVAEGTGSLAPPGGLDCDGDGTDEAAPGEPLVCEVSPAANGIASVADAITRLVLAARLPSAAAVRVTGDTAALEALSGETTAVVDRRFSAALDVTATFGCDAGDVGRVFPMRVEGALSGARVAAADIAVRCLPAAAVARAVPPGYLAARPADPRPALVAAAQPPPPPAHQLPNAPVANVNAQVNPHPHVGLAPHEAEQPQLAFADERVPTEAAWLAGAAALTAGAAFGLRRTRTGAAPARGSRR